MQMLERGRGGLAVSRALCVEGRDFPPHRFGDGGGLDGALLGEVVHQDVEGERETGKRAIEVIVHLRSFPLVHNIPLLRCVS